MKDKVHNRNCNGIRILCVKREVKGGVVETYKCDKCGKRFEKFLKGKTIVNG